MFWGRQAPGDVPRVLGPDHEQHARVPALQDADRHRGAAAAYLQGVDMQLPSGFNSRIRSLRALHSTSHVHKTPHQFPRSPYTLSSHPARTLYASTFIIFVPASFPFGHPRRSRPLALSCLPGHCVTVDCTIHAQNQFLSAGFLELRPREVFGVTRDTRAIMLRTWGARGTGPGHEGVCVCVSSTGSCPHDSLLSVLAPGTGLRRS